MEKWVVIPKAFPINLKNVYSWQDPRRSPRRKIIISEIKIYPKKLVLKGFAMNLYGIKLLGMLSLNRK
jgi:hypothetical protein